MTTTATLVALLALAASAGPPSGVAILLSRDLGVSEREATDLAVGVASALVEAGLAVDATTAETIRRVPGLGKCARRPACVAEKTAGLGVAAVVTVEIGALRDMAVLYLAAFSTREPLLLGELETTGPRAELGRRESGTPAAFARRVSASLLALSKAEPAVTAEATKPAPVAPVAVVAPDDVPRRVEPEVAKPIAVVPVDSGQPAVDAAVALRGAEPGSGRRAAAWVAAGGAVASAVTAAIYYGLFAARRDDFNAWTDHDSRYPPATQQTMDERERGAKRLKDEGNLRATLALTTAISAGVLGAAAGTLFLIPTEESR